MTAILGYGNLIDSATVTGSGWDTNYPVTAVQNPRLFRKARTTANSATISITLPTAAPIGVIALCAHSMPAGTTVRVQGGAFDSGVVAIYPGDDYALAIAPETASAWTITIASSAIFDIGRVFIGRAFQPATCVDWGFSTGFESSSTIVEALAGPEYADIRSVRRVWSGQFSWLTTAEAATFSSVMRSSDISGEVFWLPRSELTTGQGEAWFLGRFKQLSALAYPYLDVYSVPVEISELL